MPQLTRALNGGFRPCERADLSLSGGHHPLSVAADLTHYDFAGQFVQRHITFLVGFHKATEIQHIVVSWWNVLHLG